MSRQWSREKYEAAIWNDPNPPSYHDWSLPSLGLSDAELRRHREDMDRHRRREEAGERRAYRHARGDFSHEHDRARLDALRAADRYTEEPAHRAPRRPPEPVVPAVVLPGTPHDITRAVNRALRGQPLPHKIDEDIHRALRSPDFVSATFQRIRSVLGEGWGVLHSMSHDMVALWLKRGDECVSIVASQGRESLGVSWLVTASHPWQRPEIADTGEPDMYGWQSVAASVAEDAP
jgi:hypothetical protein